MRAKTITAFPAMGEAIVMGADFQSLITVLYRDESGTTHDVTGLAVDGNAIKGNWPESVHATAANIRVHYVPIPEVDSEAVEAAPIIKATKVKRK